MLDPILGERNTSRTCFQAAHDVRGRFLPGWHSLGLCRVQEVGGRGQCPLTGRGECLDVLEEFIS